MTEAHITHLSQEEWDSKHRRTLLKSRGFKVEGGKVMGEVTWNLCWANTVRVVQVIKEGHEAEIGLGNEDKGLTEEIEEAKRLVAKLGKAVERYEGERIVEEAGWGKTAARIVEDQKKREAEQAAGIEFQRVWMISKMDYELRGVNNCIISQGARHKHGKLDGVVGIDHQEGWVVVVQTVLSECSVSGTNE